MSVINFLVDRMHVCTPYLDVARDIYRRCRRAGLDRAARKRAIGDALRRHHANRSLVRDFCL